jgi:hypothetical protein
MSRYIFFTFRPHPNDLQLFEDYLTCFLPLLKSHPVWGYSIEKDDSPARHLHAIFQGPYRDAEKFTNSQKVKKFKKYKELIKRNTSTQEAGWKVKTVADTHEDLLNTIGYCFKDQSVVRYGYNISESLLTESLQYYHANKRLEAMTPPMGDYTIINDKNFYRYVELFIKNPDNKTDISDLHLFYKMAQQGLMIQIPTKKVQLYLSQLAAKMGVDKSGHKMILKQYNKGNECQTDYKTNYTYVQDNNYTDLIYHDDHQLNPNYSDLVSPS